MDASAYTSALLGQLSWNVKFLFFLAAKYIGSGRWLCSMIPP